MVLANRQSCRIKKTHYLHLVVVYPSLEFSMLSQIDICAV
jgi:hypothetical protein